MKEIIIYKCEICGKESKFKKKMENHEVECKVAAALEKKRLKELDKNKKKFIDSFSFDKLAENINIFLEATCGDHIEDLHFKVNYRERVSNTHSCPMDGVENFSCNPDKPRGYPGFEGKITGKYSKNKKTLSEYTSWHRKSQMPGIHTGSGSGNGKDWQYGFKLYLQDFPKFEKEFNERHELKKAKSLLTSGDYIIRESYEF